MDEKLSAAIATAPKKVLVDVVKLAQKQGRQGSKGSWKDFLNVHDRKLGSSLSDPGRRNHETLASFLETFTDKENLKFLVNIFQKISNREVMEQIIKGSPDNELPEQKLVRSTLEHPLYLSKYGFPSSYEEDWVVTKVGKKSKFMGSSMMLAIDCEMVLCEDGTDALARVCVVDHKLQVKLDEKVNPFKPVADYRTEITGIAAGDFDCVTTSLANVQTSLKKLLSSGTILVGHGLNNDLQALKLDHARVIDTSFLFKSRDGRSPSLNNLCKSILGYELRKEGAPHNCLEDARAAMKLVLAKIEKGVDYEFPLIQDNAKHVLENEMAKLLLHRIPINLPKEELYGLLPGNFTIETKPQKAQAVQYSVYAIFKNPEEAHQAFEKLDGSLEKDSFGKSQKLVTLNLKNGNAITIYVRKMFNDSRLPQVSLKKRGIEGEISGEPKRQKTDQCDDHLKEIERLQQELREEKESHERVHLEEIERLKQELREKESNEHIHLKEIESLKFQNSTSDKIITSLKKKLKEQGTRKRAVKLTS